MRETAATVSGGMKYAPHPNGTAYPGRGGLPLKFFLVGALFACGLHLGDTYRLMFGSAGEEAAVMFVAAPNENAAVSRS